MLTDSGAGGSCRLIWIKGVPDRACVPGHSGRTFLIPGTTRSLLSLDRPGSPGVSDHKEQDWRLSGVALIVDDQHQQWCLAAKTPSAEPKLQKCIHAPRESASNRWGSRHFAVGWHRVDKMKM
jgi:hypothetical protein